MQKRIMFILVIVLFLCACKGSFCLASNLSLLDNACVDEVVEKYNAVIVKKCKKIYGEMNDYCIAKEKGKSNLDREEVYKYGLGGRDDQIIKYITDDDKNVMEIEIILNMTSPLVLHEFNKMDSHIVSFVLENILDSIGMLKGIERGRLIEIHNELYDIGLFRKETKKIIFENNKKRYCVEKTYDRLLNSTKILVYTE